MTLIDPAQSKADFAEGFGLFPIDSEAELDESIALLRKAIKANPANGFAHGALAYAYLVTWLGRWKPNLEVWEGRFLREARTHCQYAIAYCGHHHDSWWARAWFYVSAAKAQPMPAQREEYYKLARQAIKAGDHWHLGTDAYYLLERATIRLNLGPESDDDTDEILQDLEHFAGHGRWCRWAYAEGLYVRAGRKGGASDYDLALGQIKTILEGKLPLPGHLIDVWLLKAMCHAQRGEIDPASDALESFHDAFAARRGGAPIWDIADDRRAVSFAKGPDLRHWLEGLCKARNAKPGNGDFLADAAGICGKLADKGYLFESYDTALPDPSIDWPTT